MATTPVVTNPHSFATTAEECPWCAERRDCYRHCVECGQERPHPDHFSDVVGVPAPLQAMREALAEYEADPIGDDPTIDKLAWTRQAIAALRKRLAQVEDEIADFLLDVLPGGGYEVPGIGVLEAKATRRAPKWDGESLVKILVAQALDERRIDPKTGEVLDREADVVARVLAECSAITTPSHSWRTRALRARNIDPDEYVEHSGWVRKVVVS